MKGKDDRGIQRIQCYYTVTNVTIICTLPHMYGHCNHKCCFIVDAGNSGGINNFIYAQPIISTTGINMFITQHIISKIQTIGTGNYVPSIKDKPVHTYDTLSHPPPTQNMSTSTEC